MRFLDYVIEKRSTGLRRYRVRAKGYVAINGVPTPRHYAFTRRGAEHWLRKFKAGDKWKQVSR